MKTRIKFLAMASVLALSSLTASAQYRTDSTATTVLTLEDALKIALSENVSVKVADKEIERSEYARKGTYASLFPTVDGSGSFQRTIKKQVMYMDFDYSSLTGGDSSADASAASDASSDDSGSSSSGGGFEVGRWNTYSAGVTASMPLINAQLWKSISISGDAVELAVEQARSSRLDMVTQVKQAFYAVLLAKEAFNVYKSVYENAVENFSLTEKKYNAQRASELEYIRAKSNIASAIPNVLNADNSVVLALWQLKAVMGVDLEMNIDVAGTLSDYTSDMTYTATKEDNYDLDDNTTMRQLAIQAEQLSKTVKLQQAAYYPSLALAYSYSYSAMTNDFKFSEYRWTPYSYIGISLSIPIFSGGKRLNDVRQAKVQAAELDMQRINTERQLKISIKSYLNTMETNMKSYDAAQDAVATAQKAYDISTKSYNVGKSTLTDLNDAQLALTQAKLSESQAIYNYMVAKSNLEQTIGADFIDDNGNVDLQNR